MTIPELKAQVLYNNQQGQAVLVCCESAQDGGTSEQCVQFVRMCVRARVSEWVSDDASESAVAGNKAGPTSQWTQWWWLSIKGRRQCAS